MPPPSAYATAHKPNPSPARDGILCALILLAALAIAHPVAEMGFVDDFSYIKTAQVFAATHRFVYNGWATAMLGWMVPWGALAVHLFDFSFTAVRLSMLPVAALSVILFHDALRRFGIGSHDAVLGTLTLALSPLFFPLSATFMTDIAGLFVLLITLNLCQRALAARTAGAAVFTLASATALNLVGGTARQIAWLGALVMVPSAAWLLRRRHKSVLPAAVLFWIVSLLSIVACTRWFDRQPYAVPETIIQARVTAHLVAHLATELLKALLCLFLLILPLTLAWLTTVRTLPGGARLRIGSILLALAAAAFLLGRRGALEHRVMPWLGHVIGTLSIFPSTGEMLGSRVTTLNMPARVLLSLLVIGAALVVVEHLIERSRAPNPGPPDTAAHEARWLLGPFTLAYAVFLVPRAMYSFIYDRYLLGILPAAIVAILLAHRRWVRSQLPALSSLALAIIALYTVAATHDWFALNRARVSAVSRIRSTGVPLTSIQGGFDFDGWTQIEAAGHINDERIRNPPGAYHLDLAAARLPGDCRLNFAGFTPAIEPRYFVTFQPMPCLAPSSLGPVSYSTWLPPFRRSIFIERLPNQPEALR